MNTIQKRQTMVDKHKAFLTERQKSVVVGTLLTDGFIEVSPNGKTARVGVELSVKGESLVKHWLNLMLPFCSGHIEYFERPPLTKGSDKIKMVRVRTFFHAQFLQFVEPFEEQVTLTNDSVKHKKKKNVPDYRYLMQHLNYEMFAIMLMMDGSVKNQGRGMEIHIQGFTREAQDRLCLALYHKFGIKCWASEYKESSQPKNVNVTSIVKYHITISGFSLQIIRQKILPWMLPDFSYKVPKLSAKVVTKTSQSPFVKWYKSMKTQAWVKELNLGV